MVRYSPALTLGQARHQYFERSGFADGAYAERWVRLKAGPIILWFPNTSARVRAVKLHDLHHVLAEYGTTWTGEAEIGAWEIASGCAGHYPAWILNCGAVAIGLVIAPRYTYRAFVRGRHSRNLYRTEFSEALLDRTVGEVRRQLDLDHAGSRATMADGAAFLLCAVTTVVISLLPWALVLMLVCSPLLVWRLLVH
jgi:hypothetical protein